MCKWTSMFGLFFMAAVAVYSDQAIAADTVKGGSPTVVTAVDDPFATTPATQPADTKPARPPQVNVTPAGTVEIHVSDASLVEVLRMLSVQAQKNIIASKDVRGTVTANLYDVTVREAMDAILTSNGYTYREKGNFIYVYTLKEVQEMELSQRKTGTEVFRVHYVTAANALNMIKPVLSANGQAAITTPASGGLESGTGDTGKDNHASEDMLVVSDFQENLDKVKTLLKQIDRRPQQILIEATIMRAALSGDNALGVDFTIMGGVDFAGLTAAGSNTGEALSGAIVNKSSAAGVVDKGYAGGQTGFTSGVPTGGLRVGLVTNNVAAFVSALESTTHAVVLANPKILALNKQKGEVIVGRKDGYMTTTFTQTTSVQTIEFLDTGTRLVFRPFIGDDGFIRMEIHPEDSSGGLNASNLPFKITTEVTSNIMIRDGHTILIGGLFRESSDTSRAQVPGLGNMPVLGNLFRNQRDRTTREEIIILLTPHIIKDDAAYAKASGEQLKETEKLRIGVRKGMMGFGRERLAESAYEAAVAAMSKPTPDTKSALWHLDCATNLNPLFPEAINMKQAVSGREVTLPECNTVRGFLKRQIIAERAAMPATVGVAAPATQPAVAVSAQPATMPAGDHVPSCDATADVKEPVCEMQEEQVDEETALAPTTRPAVEDNAPAVTVTVTELPTEENDADAGK